MKNIKEVLNFIIKILEYNGINNLNIEMLWKSKYNEPVDVFQFKIANLKLLINYILYGNNENIDYNWCNSYDIVEDEHKVT